MLYAPNDPHPSSATETERRATSRFDELSGDDAFQQKIAEAAYFNAQRRDFAPGQEMNDWLRAEQEIRNQFKGKD